MDSGYISPRKNYYTFNHFLDSLKILSTTTEDESFCREKNTDRLNTTTSRNEITEMKKINNDLMFQIEKLKNDIKKEKNFNSELTTNFQIIQNKFNNDIKALEISNEEKDKKINELNLTLSKQSELTDSLQTTIGNYQNLIEKMKSTLEKQQAQINNGNSNSNPALIQEIKLKDQLISTLQKKIEAHDEMLGDLNKMKDEVESYGDKIKELYGEIDERDKIIDDMKKKINNPKVEEKEINIDYKQQFLKEFEINQKTKKDIANIDVMIKQLIQSKEDMKKSYEKKIEELLTENDKLKHNKGGESAELISLKKDNVELTKLNAHLLEQMNKLPQLENQFKKFFDEMVLLKNENEELKKMLINQNALLSGDNANNPQDPIEHPITGEEGQQEEDNQPEEEEGNKEQEEIDANTKKKIHAELTLFSIQPQYILGFNFANKKFMMYQPPDYQAFMKHYNPLGTITYNTLTGLFVLTGKQFNQIFYYSLKSNTISEFFTLPTNHQNGIIFLDSTSKYLIAVSGINTNKVERLCFETTKVEELPPLSTARGEASCCLIKEVAYVFFGYSPEKKKCLSSIEYLDMNNLNAGWKLINLGQPEFELKGISTFRLGEHEIFIVGGENIKGIPNDNMLYFSAEDKTIKTFDKKSQGEEKLPYLFKKNSMFNFFSDGELLYFSNFDDNNCVHVIDNNLKYNIYSS